ncbi:MAG: hypothetical protein M3261_02680 [Thermoproteota archaeon]|nr:hypothetical protein [Thermoproteota archaeon]
MTPISEAFKKGHHPSPYKKEYWQNELESLGIKSKRQSELNDDNELEALAEIIKQVYFHDYRLLILLLRAIKARDEINTVGIRI